MGDIRAFKPTIMTGCVYFLLYLQFLPSSSIPHTDSKTLSLILGVPAVWELIRKGILSKVTAGGSVKSSIFHGALAAKSWTRKLPIVGSVVGAVTDKVVFNQVKAATGGNLTYAVNGGEFSFC